MFQTFQNNHEFALDKLLNVASADPESSGNWDFDYIGEEGYCYVCEEELRIEQICTCTKYLDICVWGGEYDCTESEEIKIDKYDCTLTGSSC